MRTSKNTNGKSGSGLFLISVIALLIVTACDSSLRKERYMHSFRKFMEKTEKYAPEYTYEDWAKSDSLFAIYVEVDYPKYKEELTEEERTEVRELMGMYTGLSLKYKSNLIKETIIEGIKDTRDIVKGIKKVFVTDTLEDGETDF